MAGPSRRQLRAAMRTGVSDLSFQGRGEVQLRTLWGKLDEGDGSQLLAELFKYYHALKEGLVVQPGAACPGTGVSSEFSASSPRSP